MERSLVLVILLTNTITVIALPVLMLLQFRPWLDAARFLFLLVAHIGTAVAFTVWNPNFTCPEQTPDEEGECKLINMCILLANWVVPAFLVSYALGLALMVYRQSAFSKLSFEHDEEATMGRGSILPMMKPDVAERTTFSVDTMPAGLVQKAASPERGHRGSARLSKPVPALYF